MSNPSDTKISPRHRGRKILLIFAIFSLLLVSAGVAAYWWNNRPITPTLLDAIEQQSLNQKLEVTQKRTYQSGDKSITLTEREVNALIHSNTGLGDKVKFELANDAIHARIRTELDEDIPVVGGRTLKMKARFLLKNADGHPAIILDDVTVWGISLPNAWLAEFKGKNLVEDLGFNVSEDHSTPGIKNIQVRDGEITIELAE